MVFLISGLSLWNYFVANFVGGFPRNDVTRRLNCNWSFFIVWADLYDLEQVKNKGHLH